MLYRLSYVRAEAKCSPAPRQVRKSDFRLADTEGTLGACGGVRS
jgi:hypothetical protein